MAKRVFRVLRFGFCLMLFCYIQHLFLVSTSAVTNASISITLSSLPVLNASPGTLGTVSQTIEVTTDNYTGYMASLTNPVDSTDLINSSDNSLIIPTITLPTGSSSVTENTFGRGYGISADGINFVPAPTTSSPIMINNRNTSGTGSHTLTFGANPSETTAPGAYSRTFVIVAIVNNPQFSINYEENTVDSVNNMPSDIPVTISNQSSVTLSNTIPTRAGYTFLGWDQNSAATTPTYASGNTNTIDLEPTLANSIILYAIWKEVHTITYNNLTDNNFPSEIVDGGTLTITTTDSDITSLAVEMGSTTLTEGINYTYTNDVLTVPNVIDNLIITATITPPVVVDYTETFAATDAPTASATTQLNNMSPNDFITKIFEYTNNTGRTISSITVSIVYSKGNQGGTSGSLIGHLDYNGNTYTASPITIPRNKATNQTKEIASFTNLNIPSSSNITFRIGTDSDSFNAGITISSQTVTITFAD